MTLVTQPASKPEHVRRNVAIVLALLAIVTIAGAGIYGFTSGISGCFGRCGVPFHAIYPTALQCRIQNDYCEISISNNETSSALAIGCEFQSIYAVNGNNQSLTTISAGAGLLSDKPGGPATSTSIPVGTSATVYCTDVTHPSSTLKVGGQADGEVLFTNQTLDIQFLGTWQESSTTT